jgi:hypothetical protein
MGAGAKLSREHVGGHDSYDQLSSLPSIQTSFIKLPDEKMIITQHQVTARNANRRPPPRPLKIFIDDSESRAPPPNDHDPKRMGATESSRGDQQNTVAPDYAAAHTPFTSQSLRLNISPTEALTTTPTTDNLTPQAGDALNARPTTSNNEVVATEDDEFDRVYVTNDTNKPFKIDALGGYDPEQDFIDAAKELETDRSGSSGASNEPEPSQSRRDLKRRSNQHHAGPLTQANGRHTQAKGAHHAGPVPGPVQEITFNDPDTDMMGASETDEVTFGQDDPYQTDLEAEMRQQEYDKLGTISAQQQRRRPAASGSAVASVDSGGAGAGQSGQEASEDEDMDSDVDVEFKQEPDSGGGGGRRRESMAATSAAAARNTPDEEGRLAARRSDSDDEGAWVNDGVDEMDIPSQSHQNSVLDKAEQRDEKAKQAAADESAEAAAANKQAGPDGGAPEGGQTNDNAEENVRMPNADYLKNDFVEDDSGYAAA